MNLEPGPEMDAAVAKALGWSVEFRCVNPPCPTGAGLRPGGQKIETIPPFSTDWNAAMQAADMVVGRGEKFPADLIDLCCEEHEPQPPAYDEIPNWEVWFFKDEILVANATAPTGPLAICRAILALKGAEHGS